MVTGHILEQVSQVSLRASKKNRCDHLTLATVRLTSSINSAVAPKATMPSSPRVKPLCASRMAMYNVIW